MRPHGAGWVGLLSLLAACATGCSSASEEDVDDSEDGVTAANATAALEIRPLDIWARPLDLKSAKLTVLRDGRSIKVKASTSTTIYLRGAGTYAIHLEAPKFDALDLSVRFDGGTADTSASLEAKDAPGGYSLAHVRRTVGGRELSAHVLYMGLRHKWFSAEGRAPRAGNKVSLMMDGQEAWSTVRSDLVRAKKEVLLSTWWWESDFELVRAPIGASEGERWNNTMLGTLESIPAEKKVLVGEFIGQDTLASLLNTDSKLRAHATTTGDGFEMMSQANETRGRFDFAIPAFAFGDRVKTSFPDAPAFAFDAKVASVVPPHAVDLTAVPFGADLPLASYHQKFMVVDHELAFVGGMNVKAADWDTSAHAIYEPGRMDIGAWDSTRTQVASKTRKPDTGPRKDYMVRVEGPAAQDVADVFRDRWEHLRSAGAKRSAFTTKLDVKGDIAPRESGIELQVTATLPAPFHEHAIAETWFNAVRNAESFIFIEDQYFRMPMIHDAIIARMEQVPNLRLVVITKPTATLSPECVQTARAASLFATRFPARFLNLQLRSFDKDTREFADIDVHSKMLIVDDFFMSVGSANKNNRGMVYEGELNVAIADPVVASYRKRIFANLIGSDDAAGEDVDAWFERLQIIAGANDAVYASKANISSPRGFVYGLKQPSANACKLQSIGPDTT